MVCKSSTQALAGSRLGVQVTNTYCHVLCSQGRPIISMLSNLDSSLRRVDQFEGETRVGGVLGRCEGIHIQIYGEKSLFLNITLKIRPRVPSPGSFPQTGLLFSNWFSNCLTEGLTSAMLTHGLSRACKHLERQLRLFPPLSKTFPKRL